MTDEKNNTSREAIYDAEIAPLITKVIEICKAHDIPIVFSAQINDDRDPSGGEIGDIGPFLCTTILTGGEGAPFANTCESLLRAASALRPRPASWAAYTIQPGGPAERVAGSEDGYDPGVPR